MSYQTFEPYTSDHHWLSKLTPEQARSKFSDLCNNIERLSDMLISAKKNPLDVMRLENERVNFRKLSDFMRMRGWL